MTRYVKYLSFGFLSLLVLFLTVFYCQSLMRGESVCLIKTFFGFECLGCGMSRAVVSLLHLDLTTAFYYNRLVVVVFPLLLIFGFVTIKNRILG